MTADVIGFVPTYGPSNCENVPWDRALQYVFTKEVLWYFTNGTKSASRSTYLQGIYLFYFNLWRVKHGSSLAYVMYFWWIVAYLPTNNCNGSRNISIDENEIWLIETSSLVFYLCIYVYVISKYFHVKKSKMLAKLQ